MSQNNILWHTIIGELSIWVWNIFLNDNTSLEVENKVHLLDTDFKNLYNTWVGSIFWKHITFTSYI